MKKTLKSIGIGICIIFAAEMCFLLFGFGSNEYAPKYSFSSPSDYTDLFNESVKHEVSLHVTNTIKGRNPISEYIYDDRISIVIYKISVDANAELDSLLVASLDAIPPALFHQYGTLAPGQLKMSYAHDSVSLARKIIISYAGGAANRIFKNKNMVSLKIMLGSLFFQYEKKRPIDVEIEKYRSKSDKIPVELTFLKKEDAVFVVLISPTFNADVDGLSRKILNENFFR